MSTIRTRETALRSSESVVGYRSSAYPYLDYEQRFPMRLTGTQITESEGHPGPYKGGDGDSGGEFFTQKSSYWDNCRKVSIEVPFGSGVYYFRGTLYPYTYLENNDASVFPDATYSSNSELDAAGTTAISRVLPTNPVAGLATALGELREGFPKIVGSDLFKVSGKPLSKRAGSEYLNYQFGWAPMVSDFKKWLKALQDSDKIWKQFQRDASRLVRRRYYFPETTEVVLDDAVANQPIGFGPTVAYLWQGGYPSAQSTLYRHVEVKRRRWFSGAFVYYLDVNSPSATAFERDLQRLQKLYGVKITPEVIWNLTPWSWAADWFGNTGDLLHNVSQFAQDGLVMPYGYMMETTTVTATYRMRDVALQGHTIPDLTQVFTTTVKRRRRATPFGFGLEFDSFSQFQLSIIAALGLSKRR